MRFKAALIQIIYKERVQIIIIMHPSKVITDPRINDTYYDPDLDKLYQYVKLGDYPPEWIDTTPYEEDDFFASFGY